MKRSVIMLLCIMVATAFSSLFAQSKRDKMWSEIQEYKIKYLAQEMELQGDQKEKFARLYQEYSNQRHENFKRQRQAEENLKDNASEEAYKKAAEISVDVKMKNATLEREYDEKFSEFLSPRQIFKMKEAEEQFRRKMQEMHRKHGGHDKKCKSGDKDCKK